MDDCVSIGIRQELIPPGPALDDEPPASQLHDNSSATGNGSGNVLHLRVPQTTMPAPSNFSMVVHGVYRSSFPRPENFAFLEKLQLKSIL